MCDPRRSACLWPVLLGIMMIMRVILIMRMIMRVIVIMMMIMRVREGVN